MLCYKLNLATRVAMAHGSRVAWLAGEHVDLHIYWSTWSGASSCVLRAVLYKGLFANQWMTGNEGHWGGGISTISQNFPKSPSILFYPLESSIS
jgi:hypothetical protein